MLDRLPLSPDRRALLAQVLRYGITGGIVTAFGVSAYWVAVHFIDWSPLASNVVAYAVSMALGYFLHARFSFRDTPSARRGSGANAAQGGKFFVTSGISFALNSAFVWLLTGPLGGADWWPIPAMVFVTPAICFVIYRKWVFA